MFTQIPPSRHLGLTVMSECRSIREEKTFILANACIYVISVLKLQNVLRAKAETERQNQQPHPATSMPLAASPPKAPTPTSLLAAVRTGGGTTSN